MLWCASLWIRCWSTNMMSCVQFSGVPECCLHSKELIDTASIWNMMHHQMQLPTIWSLKIVEHLRKVVWFWYLVSLNFVWLKSCWIVPIASLMKVTILHKKQRPPPHRPGFRKNKDLRAIPAYSRICTLCHKYLFAHAPKQDLEILVCTSNCSFMRVFGDLNTTSWLCTTPITGNKVLETNQRNIYEWHNEPCL